MHGTKISEDVIIDEGLKRCGKSCRVRWLNYLRPNIKRGNITPEEEDLIMRLHKLLGNRSTTAFIFRYFVSSLWIDFVTAERKTIGICRWSLIAGKLPGRTDTEIKNHWNTYCHKKEDHQ